MTVPLLLDLTVGEPDPGTGVVSLAVAVDLVTAAAGAGVVAVRLRDGDAAPGVLDPSVVASYLAPLAPSLGYLVDVPTTQHAPYNTARRVLSLDRATGGRAGVVLRPGVGDDVSDGVPDRPVPAVTPGERWAEYAAVLTGLWESFPREALLGDQEAAIVVDDTLLRPIHHEGAAYRVAGPLDGPSSVQGRPVLAVADVAAIGWEAAASADLVILDPDDLDGAGTALAAALEATGRQRTEVVLAGRWTGAGGSDVADLPTWAADRGLQALLLAPEGGAADVREVLSTLSALAPPPNDATGRDTLRRALGLATTRTEVPA
ncbi:LLM class flavin-dependent oxidoreductase [Nocardioides zeae]|uniref:Alkanesulfonate monooxygenase SsuD/methylene tetrahydromethanopterin reductase-like flavin-dependent oxidoreductase (Luciferase family) n=1 Tax=Nocardioides zeae TaxID=1457234 RepID=A0AAJ1U4Y5_9ACTN|nr:LLM class flavin-dependent oxidoreductase [Nocardioides zeae]MDQ1105253.1 alkanesulfonate monooxygenase SsuD/methylene tetrahydromethanopterin reductase-like flavin-dependent oxidoreductase (luciferase family) [Nocardioides zeae]